MIPARAVGLPKALRMYLAHKAISAAHIGVRPSVPTLSFDNFMP